MGIDRHRAQRPSATELLAQEPHVEPRDGRIGEDDRDRPEQHPIDDEDHRPDERDRAKAHNVGHGQGGDDESGGEVADEFHGAEPVHTGEHRCVGARWESHRHGVA